jgi:hypothetical protein
MKPFCKYLILLLPIAIGTATQTARAQSTANFTQIQNYRVTYGVADHDPRQLMILRSFDDHDRHYLLLVNPQTLETRVDLASFYQVREMTIAAARAFFKNTPYERALEKAESASVAIQDAGIETGVPKEKGISLTADLCPSHKPIPRQLFTQMITDFKTVEQPVPIALSITGVWMRQHPADLLWLKGLEAQHQIIITWINHSYTHRVSATAPLKLNFLLEPGTDISYEVLETEKAMLRNGLLPSAFFRFPGLVSDQQLVYRITDFGLIPIGTDAWLAKGQQAQNGSIVLIHGNGNEPIGVQDFLKLLHQNAAKIAQKQWLLYDLTSTVDEDFEE